MEGPLKTAMKLIRSGHSSKIQAITELQEMILNLEYPHGSNLDELFALIEISVCKRWSTANILCLFCGTLGRAGLLT